MINNNLFKIMFNLEGQKVLITGACGGIGSAMARKFSQQGAIVGLCGRNEKKLQALANELPNKSFCFVCNLDNKEEVESLFDKADETMGGVEILVCNAGITKDNLAIRMSDEEFESVINVNLNATFYLNRSAIKKMMKKKYGRIINIASVVGVAGNPGQANYVASKAGIIGMSKSLAMECAKRGITVNCIAPGFIKSPMTDVLNDDQKARIMAGIPMDRMGDPDEIANSAIFLASKEASYITGQTLHVNGGMLMA